MQSNEKWADSIEGDKSLGHCTYLVVVRNIFLKDITVKPF
jgi:hypothetical protein